MNKHIFDACIFEYLQAPFFGHNTAQHAVFQWGQPVNDAF